MAMFLGGADVLGRGAVSLQHEVLSEPRETRPFLLRRLGASSVHVGTFWRPNLYHLNLQKSIYEADV
jgi:hypothetical protein